MKPYSEGNQGSNWVSFCNKIGDREDKTLRHYLFNNIKLNVYEEDTQINYFSIKPERVSKIEVLVNLQS